VGAQLLKNRSTIDVERFLSLIRFENREKMDEIGLYSLLKEEFGFESA
jgi:hypothetical protein